MFQRDVSRFRLVPPNVMVRIVGGECTGSCRLGHVFLTFLSFPPSPVHPPLSAARFFFFLLLLSLSPSRGATKRSKSGGEGARERGHEARQAAVEWERRVVEGGRGNEVLYLCLSLPRLVHLSFPPPRDSGREEHYNSPSLLSSLLVLVANLSPSPHLASSSSSTTSVLPLPSPPSSPSYPVPRPVTRSWPSFNVPPPLRCVHSQLHTTRRRPEMQGHAALRFSRVKPSLIPGATLHTIRERHGVASPLWPTLPLVQHVVTTDVTSRAPSRGCCGVTRTLGPVHIAQFLIDR